MKKLLIIAQLVFGLLLLSPVAASEESKETEVVFLRSSTVGAFIKSTIYEVTDGEIKFIGILANKKKISYKTTGGKHMFMVVSEAADFMEANLEDGKTYYSVITPRMGAWKARFSMWPIRNDESSEYYFGSEKFNKWMDKVKPHEPGKKDAKWFEKNQDSVAKKKAKYWEKWLEKTPEDLAQKTLNPEDAWID
ncbi:MAG: hypothetical protein KDI92_02840 [Xanthomonadales bacterium]|nr:hypothetical protein [Xanthomonadales bacterium]